MLSDDLGLLVGRKYSSYIPKHFYMLLTGVLRTVPQYAQYGGRQGMVANG